MMSHVRTIEKIERDLTLACDLTQQIIDLASQTKLDDIDKLNSQRIGLIESIFSNDKAMINVAMAKSLLGLNTQAESVLKNKLKLNIEEQKKCRKGNIAHNAYMSHSL